MKRIFLALTVLCLVPVCALAGETDGDCMYYLVDEVGAALTMRAGRMYVDDEYIASDNRHFRVARVDDDACVAYAEYLGVSAVSAETRLAALGVAQAAENRIVCMYSTHSDESYVPTDGESSKWEDAGIYDVGNAFKEALEEKGITVVYSEESFLPHDTGAYSRSASTAEDLMKKSPDALFDIHRDAVPAEQYETEVEGDDISMVRLFVGRSNANSKANMAFAKEIKAAADEEYPGLIKDIYVGKGNYNQELYPHALLLEFGTHEIDKEKAMGATAYMANVVESVLYGDSAQASDDAGTNSGAAKGIIWIVAIAIVAAVVYALAATGRLGGMWKRIKRSLSEITGGWRK